MISHILFDFFGTLVDYSPSRTEQGYERTHRLLRAAGCRLGYAEFLSLWSELSAEFEAVAVESHREYSMAQVAGGFLRRIGLEPDEALNREFVESYLSEWNKGVRYSERVPQMLERLHERFELAVITNTHDRELVPAHLRRMGVAGFFGCTVTSVEVGTRKPAAGIFLHTLRRLDVSPERCVYVGDSYEADFLGAESASIRPLLIDPDRDAPVSPQNRLSSIFELESRLSAEP